MICTFFDRHDEAILNQIPKKRYKKKISKQYRSQNNPLTVKLKLQKKTNY